MHFNKTILLLLFFASLAGAQNLHAQDNGKKKKSKKTGTEQVSEPKKGDNDKIDRLLLEAEKAKVVEDWELAIKGYRDIIIIDPNNANAHFQLAQIFSTQGKAQDAENEAVIAVKADGGNKWYMELLANIYLNEGKAKDAENSYKTLIEKFPGNPEYYYNLGYLYSRQGQYDNAIKTYDQFEKLFGVDEQVIEEKKNLFLRMNKFNDAVDEVRKLEDAFPGETQYMLMEADLYRLKKMKDKAIEVYKKVLALEPDNSQAQLAMAELTLQNGSTEQKFESLKEIFSNPKVGIDTKVNILVISYIQMNSEDSLKRKEALALAEILINIHPDDPKAFSVRGDLLYIDNQLDKAVTSYQKALSLKQDVFEVWQQVLRIEAQKRDWSAVMKTANEAMELFPNQAMIYLFKGEAEMQLKDYEKALKSFQRGEKMCTDKESDKLHAQFLANMGDVYHSLNNNPESDNSYDKSLKLDPENAYVLNNYSYYLSVRKENLEKAKQMSAYSNKIEPDNNSFLDTYAWILFQMNDYTGAKEWQEKAMKAGGDKSGTILEHYGDILFKLGKKDDALIYWHKAKDLGTDSGTIERKIAEQKYVE